MKKGSVIFAVAFAMICVSVFAPLDRGKVYTARSFGGRLCSFKLRKKKKAAPMGEQPEYLPGKRRKTRRAAEPNGLFRSLPLRGRGIISHRTAA